VLRNRRSWFIAGLLIIVIVGIGAYYYTTSSAAETATEEPEIQTSVARQGDITVSATGAGTVIPATEVALSFGITGVVHELQVQVGDKVQSGDELARLDDTEAQQAVANAELQLRQITMQTKGSATDTGVSYDDISVEQAEINLKLAQSVLDDLLNWEPDEVDVALAEANQAAAEAAFSAARGQEASNYTSSQISAISLEQAKQAVIDAQAAMKTAFDPGREWELYIDDPSCKTGEQHPNCTGEPYSDRIERERAVAENAMTRAQDNLEIAQLQYNSSISSSNNSSSTNAQSNIIAAQQALEAAKSGPVGDDIEAARTAVRQAELFLKEALLNRESNVLNLAQAQLNVESVLTLLEETVLISPIDGTVMAVNVSVGESVSGPVIVIADLEQPLLELFIDETDLETVGIDYEVEVVFNALPDNIFSGRVIQVDPMLSDISGVSVVRAVVQLDNDSFAKPQTLPVGLNGTVEVIGGRAQNAVLVPVEALRELSPGEYAVFVMESGEPQLRFVDVGLMDFSFAEILSGVEAGETVTTGIIDTN
jgi:multidrug efflux pump subunit AcrA (membrane-fusion protein)